MYKFKEFKNFKLIIVLIFQSACVTILDHPPVHAVQAENVHVTLVTLEISVMLLLVIVLLGITKMDLSAVVSILFLDSWNMPWNVERNFLESLLNFKHIRQMLFLLACGCYSNGSSSIDCSSSGECACNPGYTGDKCDSCDEGYYKSGSDCIGNIFVLMIRTHYYIIDCIDWFIFNIWKMYILLLT